MQSTIVILGSGGTIAGAAADPADHVGYTAGQIGVAQLVAAVPALAGQPIDCEQVAQVDSKDMSYEIWQRLAQRVVHHLVRADVAGIVITHGTDTLEETAYFLHRVVPATKPVVLTAAMRPATALAPDGPQNLLDAVTLARSDAAGGVRVALAGTVHDALHVRKVHTYRLDAFGSGDAGPWGVIEEGRLRRLGATSPAAALGLAVIARDPAAWPAVEIVASQAGARGEVVDALVAAGAAGLVVAGTGNGTLHEALLPALARAQARGLPVWRATRCPEGVIVGAPAGALPSAGPLSPVKARIELMLQLLAGRGITPPSS
jgi:L-asparaginase